MNAFVSPLGDIMPRTQGMEMSFLLFWAGRVQLLNDKADGNLFQAFVVKKSNVLFRPGINITLRDIFVFIVTTPTKTCSTRWGTNLTITFRDSFHSCTKLKGSIGLILNVPFAFF